MVNLVKKQITFRMEQDGKIRILVDRLNGESNEFLSVLNGFRFVLNERGESNGFLPAPQVYKKNTRVARFGGRSEGRAAA